MSKQRTKKQTTGERIAAKAFDPDYYDISVLARRIDRAIAARDRRAIKIIEKWRNNPNTSQQANATLARIIEEINRP